MSCSCFIEIQIGFTFLVPSCPVGLGKRPLKGCLFVLLMLIRTKNSVCLDVISDSDDNWIHSSIVSCFYPLSRMRWDVASFMLAVKHLYCIVKTCCSAFTVAYSSHEFAEFAVDCYMSYNTAWFFDTRRCRIRN